MSSPTDPSPKPARPDNDIPWQLVDDEPGYTRVIFQGHDGIFRLAADHPEYARIREVLESAIRQNARVRFIARLRDLELIEVVSADS